MVILSCIERIGIHFGETTFYTVQYKMNKEIICPNTGNQSVIYNVYKNGAMACEFLDVIHIKSFFKVH